MAKTRTINELRQTKDIVYTNPGAEKKYKFQEVKWDVEGHKKYNEERLNAGYSEIDIETTKDLIFNSLKNKFYDMIFQAVCDEMEKHEVFQAETYFTPQGLNEFEDTWFEFYHEHHGDILGSIMKDFTN